MGGQGEGDASDIPALHPYLTSPVKGEEPINLPAVNGVIEQHQDAFFVVKYAWIAWAAFLPAPMAEMTVAAPVTMSPPA